MNLVEKIVFDAEPRVFIVFITIDVNTCINSMTICANANH